MRIGRHMYPSTNQECEDFPIKIKEYSSQEYSFPHLLYRRFNPPIQ
jgi:hypothetical protein